MTENIIGDEVGKIHEAWSLIGQGDLARRWKISVRTLQRWRADGNGPPFLAIGAAIRYRINDILAFEARMLRGGDDA